MNVFKISRENNEMRKLIENYCVIYDRDNKQAIKIG